MYPTRVVLRPSSGHRVAKASPPLCRGLSSGFYPPAQFWSAPRSSLGPFAAQNDLAPFFRILDDTTRAFDALPSFFGSAAGQQSSVWQPRFDVRERDGAFELRGELPGVEAKDLDIQFTDTETLVVRGQTESTYTQSEQPQAAPASVSAKDTSDSPAPPATSDEPNDSDTASVHSDSSYVQPTVEDDVPETASTLTGEPTPAESTAEAQTVKAQRQEGHDKPRYWLSERRTGKFQRTFTFGQRIDQDGVTASLKDGILSVTVPKAAVPEPRRISVL